ncbi:hypothetical protein XENOCAPTIV_017419 [Xenoophorus captivus]|uniref:Uncharacterized protein n=1 Tax=Xenoophorus captivus TaxID=1517983 RepID=A0ABV0QIV2_9TELE
MFSRQMYGRYTQELGVFAKEEAARLKESGQRRSTSERSRTQDLLEYKGRCAKCHKSQSLPAYTSQQPGVTSHSVKTESPLVLSNNNCRQLCQCFVLISRFVCLRVLPSHLPDELQCCFAGS